MSTRLHFPTQEIQQPTIHSIPTFKPTQNHIYQLRNTHQRVVAVAVIHSLTLRSAQENVKYSTRTAVRCLIIQHDKICIIHVKKGNYYKFPGGGVEPEDLEGDESHTVSCQRECLEETGCEVLVRPEVFAQTAEFRGTLR